MIGKRLEHGGFGNGLVQETRHKGLELYVLFEDGLKRWVRIEDVRFLSATPVIEAARPLVSTPTTEAFRSRSMVEAFRLGIVPFGMVEDFTFGRDAEISQMKQWLDSKDIGALVVEGEYGSGKSHLLEYLYALGLNQGYAVAMAELDPNETPGFKPKAVYRKLIQSFRYKAGTGIGNFQDFLRALAKQGKDHFQDHCYLGNALSKIGTTQESEWLWSWIEGRESFYEPVLYDHGTAASLYCNILAGLAWGAGAVLELKGLVLILDEAESVDTWWYYPYQRDKALNLVCGLALLAANDSRLSAETIMLEIVGRYPGIRRRFGKETDLMYHGHASRVRYCFRFPSFLKVAFAFTPTNIVKKLEQRGAGLLRMNVQPLSEPALKDVFDHICLLYDSGYNFLESDRDVQGCFELVRRKSRSVTRSFVKGSVEILDVRRFHPGMSLDQIE